jgi:hypothetical protein
MWSPAVALTAGFIRDVQVTGSLGPAGTVFVAAMNEGTGGLSPRQNFFFRSDDGGVTWTPAIPLGDPFPAPGDGTCPSNPYFARFFPIWRTQGWGQPGASRDGVVHYVYAGAGVNPGDPGDIFYQQSSDNANTWSAPIVLNTDSATGGTNGQWQPSLSVTNDLPSKVRVSWYDRRNTSDGMNYEYYGIESLDNGQTFGPDFAISSVLIPQPAQPDPGMQPCYAGDYNYQSSFGGMSFITWTDGRVPLMGVFQQDVFFAKE